MKPNKLQVAVLVLIATSIISAIIGLFNGAKALPVLVMSIGWLCAYLMWLKVMKKSEPVFKKS